jgi:hypothetical protein
VAGSKPTYVHVISTHVELCSLKLVFDLAEIGANKESEEDWNWKHSGWI